jgi:glycerophosphoryl diester phosphodiesterase
LSFFSSPRPLVFAHRGGCALGPENTLAAFDAGLAAGADGLEIDVHLSSDGVPVVHHDDTLDRTTDASGPVAARSAAELSRLNAACRFTGSRVSGAALDPALCGVPSLADVLRRYPDARIIVEMKVDSAAMGLAVAREVRACGAVARVCAAGYGIACLRAIREALPHAATSASHPEVRCALHRSWLGWPVRRPAYAGYQVPEFAGRIRVVSPRFIRHAHAHNLKVQVWTVDEPRDMRRLLDWGVDALISNRPDLARAEVEKR